MPSEDQQLRFDQALERALAARSRAKTDNVERIYSKKQVEQGIMEAFELIGGVSRLAIWANDPENYGEFLKLYVKCLPKDVKTDEGGHVINYLSSVPDSPLNRPEPDIIGEATRVAEDDESL